MADEDTPVPLPRKDVRGHIRGIMDAIAQEPDLKPPVILAPGDVTDDGSVFVGMNPKTKQLVFAMPQDVPARHAFKEAAAKAEETNEDAPHGHSDWRLPDSDELFMLYQTQREGALKGTFNLTSGGDNTAGLYWSGTKQDGISAYTIRFNEGVPQAYHNSTPMAVRLVRQEQAGNTAQTGQRFRL